MSKYTNDEKIKILNKASIKFYDYVYNYGDELLVTDVEDIYKIAIATRLHELIVHALTLSIYDIFSDELLDYLDSDNLDINEIYNRVLFGKTIDSYLLKIYPLMLNDINIGGNGMNGTIKNRIGNCKKYIRESMEYVNRKNRSSLSEPDFNSCEIITEILNSVNTVIEDLSMKALHEYDKHDLILLDQVEFKLQMVRITVNHMESARRWSLT